MDGCKRMTPEPSPSNTRDSSDIPPRAVTYDLNFALLLERPESVLEFGTFDLEGTPVANAAVQVCVSDSTAGSDGGVLIDGGEDCALEVFFAPTVRCAAALGEQAHVDETGSCVRGGGFDGGFDQSDGLVHVGLFNRG